MYSQILKTHKSALKLFLIIFIVSLAIWKSIHNRNNSPAYVNISSQNSFASSICICLPISQNSYFQQTSPICPTFLDLNTNFPHTYAYDHSSFSSNRSSISHSHIPCLPNISKCFSPKSYLFTHNNNNINRLENPSHLAFYLLVREHVICIIAYSALLLFWFYLILNSQNSTNEHLLIKNSSQDFSQSTLFNTNIPSTIPPSPVKKPTPAHPLLYPKPPIASLPELSFHKNISKSSLLDSPLSFSPTSILLNKGSIIPNTLSPSIQPTPSKKPPSIQNNRKPSLDFSFVNKNTLSSTPSIKKYPSYDFQFSYNKTPLLDSTSTASPQNIKDIASPHFVSDKPPLSPPNSQKIIDSTSDCKKVYIKDLEFIPPFNNVENLVSSPNFDIDIKEFYIGKRSESISSSIKKISKPKFLKNKASFTRKESITTHDIPTHFYTQIDPPIPLISSPHFNNISPMQNNFTKKLLRSITVDSPYRIKHPNPFWLRISPIFASSFGFTFASMQFILLIVTITITNIMEQSKFPILFDTLSSLIKFDFVSFFTGCTVGIDPKCSPDISTKFTFKDLFLPKALIKSDYSVYPENSKDFWKTLSNNINYNSNISPPISPSEYPDVLKRFWQYQTVLTYFTLFIIYPLVYLILNSIKSKTIDPTYQDIIVPNTSAIKNNDSNKNSSENLSTIGKRQRDTSFVQLNLISPQKNDDPFFSFQNYQQSPKPISSLKYKSIIWKRVFFGMLIWFIFVSSANEILITGIKLLASFSNYLFSLSVPTKNHTENENLNPNILSFFYKNSSGLYNIWAILSSFLQNLVWPNHIFYNLHVVNSFFVLLVVLIYSPSGIMNQFRFITAVFPLSKSELARITSVHTTILKNLNKIDGDNIKKRKKFSWNYFKEKKLSRYFNWVSNPNLTNLSITGLDRSPIQKKLSLDIADSKNKSQSKSKSSDSLNISDITTPISNKLPDFNFNDVDKIEDTPIQSNDIITIKKLLHRKLKEIYNSKVFDPLKNTKRFFWSSPTLRNLSFLFIFASWGFLWILLVLQSISGMLNALFIGSNDLQLGVLHSNPDSDRNHPKYHITDLLVDISRSSEYKKFNLILANSITISIFHSLISIYLFISSICGFYNLFLNFKSSHRNQGCPPTSNPSQTPTKEKVRTDYLIELNSVSEKTRSQFPGIKRLLSTFIRQISNIQWDAIYTIRLFPFIKSTSLGSPSITKLIKHSFLILVLATGWPSVLRVINVLSKSSYSLINQPLESQLFPQIFNIKNLYLSDSKQPQRFSSSFSNSLLQFSYISNFLHNSFNLNSMKTSIHSAVCSSTSTAIYNSYLFNKKNNFSTSFHELTSIIWISSCFPNHLTNSFQYTDFSSKKETSYLKDGLCIQKNLEFSEIKIELENYGFPIKAKRNENIFNQQFLYPFFEQKNSYFNDEASSIISAIKKAAEILLEPDTSRIKGRKNFFTSHIRNNNSYFAPLNLSTKIFYLKAKFYFNSAVNYIYRIFSFSSNLIINLLRYVGIDIAPNFKSNTSGFSNGENVIETEQNILNLNENVILHSYPILYEPEFWLNLAIVDEFLTHSKANQLKRFFNICVNKLVSYPRDFEYSWKLNAFLLKPNPSISKTSSLDINLYNINIGCKMYSFLISETIDLLKQNEDPNSPKSSLGIFVRIRKRIYDNRHSVNVILALMIAIILLNRLPVLVNYLVKNNNPFAIVKDFIFGRSEQRFAKLNFQYLYGLAVLVLGFVFFKYSLPSMLNTDSFQNIGQYHQNDMQQNTNLHVSRSTSHIKPTRFIDSMVSVFDMNPESSITTLYDNPNLIAHTANSVNVKCLGDGCTNPDSSFVASNAKSIINGSTVYESAVISWLLILYRVMLTFSLIHIILIKFTVRLAKFLRRNNS
ncbi:hypothetical protein AYI69_g5341 [Smittium culicis]|uniref:Uncharacterized protein n=1 Tax=Smittium culicis TaxID=133412 RepID=A0A1R1Y6X9_9FUNG|nr:hypothetical protein AYI69_g5341 [Smittium culicis]